MKKSPRVLAKGVSAEVQITLRSAGGAGKAYSMPLETFATNKEMGRILVRRGGETVAAGKRYFLFPYHFHTVEDMGMWMT